MSINSLTIGDPFFKIRILRDEQTFRIDQKTIVLNLSDTPILVEHQSLGALQSVILADIQMENIEHAVIVEDFASHEDEAALMRRIRDTWHSAFDVRGEERLRGIEHYMSPKVWVGQFGFTIYHSASIPLNVGLHKDHAFCPVSDLEKCIPKSWALAKCSSAAKKISQRSTLKSPWRLAQRTGPCMTLKEITLGISLKPSRHQSLWPLKCCLMVRLPA